MAEPAHYLIYSPLHIIFRLLRLHRYFNTMGSSTSRNDRKDEEEIRARDAIDLAEKGLSDNRLYQLQVAAIKCLKENDLRVRRP
jgi:hypothetical protein